MIDISSSSLAIEIYNRLHGLPGNSGRCVLHILITLKLDDNISVCLLYEIMYKRLSYKVLPESTFGYKEFCCNGITAVFDSRPSGCAFKTRSSQQGLPLGRGIHPYS